MCDKNDGTSSNFKSTPPTKNKVRNPFDKALIERLHKPICSPGMCKIYKKKKDGTFTWDIDQACALAPADIVVCNSQFEPSPDPVMERIAEEATERFFSQELVIPSPLESSKKVKPLLKTYVDRSIDHASIVEACTINKREVSAQTVLTLSSVLPPEVESYFEKYCTYSEDHNLLSEYEITANGSLHRTLFFEEHMEHDDSELIDEETHVDVAPTPPSGFEPHTPVKFSPDILSRDVVAKGMKRTFGTPLQKKLPGKPCYRNKILDVVDFGEPCFSPIEFRTPTSSATPPSLNSLSISPVTKSASSDVEKNNLTPPEPEAMTCKECIKSESQSEKTGSCVCKVTPNKLLLKRSTSLKSSPHKTRSSASLSEKRSLSMSSLNRSRSVQKLDFSMDMSVDGSFHSLTKAESSTIHATNTWSIGEDTDIHLLVKTQSLREISREIQSSKETHDYLIAETPIKGKRKINILSHEISKIRSTVTLSPGQMSLDNSLDNLETQLNMEDKKMDFSKFDLNCLTESSCQYNFNTNSSTKYASDCTTSFKRVDSGFNENTFYANASSYYESAIKPSELTVTNSSKSALKEISNVTWMRVDSGFKDETNGDSMQFYPNTETSKKFTGYHFNEAQLDDKENIATDDLETFLQSGIKNEGMSISDIFTEDFNSSNFTCNFSSTPSKTKSRKVNQ